MLVSLSKKIYASKIEAREELSKKGGDFVWNEISLNPYELYQKILAGYCFAPATFGYKLRNNIEIREKKDKSGRVIGTERGIRMINKNGGVYILYPFDSDGCVYKWARTKEMWSDAQCMFVDIDGCNKSIEEYIKNIPLKPTFGFYTPSDTPNNRRFKLVYCFSEFINDRIAWMYVANYITNRATREDTLLDYCGKVATQMSFQSKGTGEWFGNIIDLDLIDWSGYNEFLKEIGDEERKEDKLKIDDEVVHCLNKWNKYKDNDEPKYYKMKSNNWKELLRRLKINDPLISYTTDELKEIPVYNPILDREEENKIKLTTKDYWELMPLVSKKGGKLKDGEHRRRALYRRMLLRRILGELNGIDITPELLLTNAVFDRHKFIDNSTEPITMKMLKDLVKNAYCKDINKIKENEIIKWYIEDFKAKSPGFKYVGNKQNMKQYETVSIKNRYEGYLYNTILNYCFDKNKSIKENTENINKALENKGWKITISEKTIYKYKGKEVKLQKEDRDSFILFKHNEGLSLSQINDELVDNGFKGMSKMGIKKIIDKLKNQPTTTIDEEKENITQKPIEDDDWAKWLFPISPKS